MGSADQSRGRRAASDSPVLHLMFPGDPDSVRRALKTAMSVFHDMSLGAAAAGTVEIVLAEVLNNVVEHAYGTHGRGLVELEVERGKTELAFRIRDEGLAMPAGDAPAGKAHDLDVSTPDLPEGGFGWFLIRNLTEDLRYQRTGARNELTFRIALDGDDPDG